jgi:hypothetical protein
MARIDNAMQLAGNIDRYISPERTPQPNYPRVPAPLRHGNRRGRGYRALGPYLLVRSLPGVNLNSNRYI